MNEYKYQVSDAQSGRIIVARGDDLKELVLEFDEMRSHFIHEETGAKSAPYDEEGKLCPQCKEGSLVRKTGTSKEGKHYDFVGCNMYPSCKYIEK